MSWFEFVAPQPVLVFFLLFTILQFENQRWTRSISRGRTGSSVLFPLIANFTGVVAVLVVILAVVLLFLSFGWRIALGTLLITWVGSSLASLAVGAVFKGDYFLLQVTSTIMMWPTGYFLIRELWAANN